MLTQIRDRAARKEGADGWRAGDRAGGREFESEGNGKSEEVE